MNTIGGADRLLKKSEVAEMLGVGVRTIERLIERRELDRVIVGERLARVPLSSVRVYVDRQLGKVA